MNDVWFVAQQQGWFSELEGKGRQFPDFWGTVLANYVSRHRALLTGDPQGIAAGSQLGRIVMEIGIDTENDPERLMARYHPPKTTARGAW